MGWAGSLCLIDILILMQLQDKFATEGANVKDRFKDNLYLLGCFAPIYLGHLTCSATLLLFLPISSTKSKYNFKN